MNTVPMNSVNPFALKPDSELLYQCPVEIIPHVMVANKLGWSLSTRQSFSQVEIEEWVRKLKGVSPTAMVKAYQARSATESKNSPFHKLMVNENVNAVYSRAYDPTPSPTFVALSVPKKEENIGHVRTTFDTAASVVTTKMTPEVHSEPFGPVAEQVEAPSAGAKAESGNVSQASQASGQLDRFSQDYKNLLGWSVTREEDDADLIASESVNMFLPCYGGVPVLDGEEIYKMSQFSTILPFQFARILLDGGKAVVECPVATADLVAIEICYGLKRSFPSEMRALVANAVAFYDKNVTWMTDPYANALILINCLYTNKRTTLNWNYAVGDALKANVLEPKYWDALFVQGARNHVWCKSRPIPRIDMDSVVKDFTSYGMHLMMFQLARGKGDVWSDAIYRVPGASRTQQYIEDALSLRREIGKEVMITGVDQATAINIAWALKNAEVRGLYVSGVPPVGKQSDLGCYFNNREAVIFHCKLVHVSSIVNSKKETPLDAFRSVRTAHHVLFSVLPRNQYHLVRSTYFPKIRGVSYYPSCEPHNGSIIVKVSDDFVMSLPEIHQEDFPIEFAYAKEHLKRCLTYSFWKTQYAFSREHVLSRTRPYGAVHLAPKSADMLHFASDLVVDPVTQVDFETIAGLNQMKPEVKDSNFNFTPPISSTASSPPPVPVSEALPVVNFGAKFAAFEAAMDEHGS